MKSKILNKKGFKRRDFLSRSAMFFAALGASPSFISETLSGWGKNFGFTDPSLYGMDLTAPYMNIHIGWRAGGPLQSMVAYKNDKLNGDREAGGANCGNGSVGARRATPWKRSHISKKSGTRPGSDLYIPTANGEALTKLWSTAENLDLGIAAGLIAEPGGIHARYFSSRNGGVTNSDVESGGMAPCPEILSYEYGTKQSIFNMANVAQRDVVGDAKGPFSAPLSIRGRADQRSMFRGVNISTQAQNLINTFAPYEGLGFSEPEFALVADAAAALDAEFHSTRRNTVDGTVILANASQGRSFVASDAHPLAPNGIIDFITPTSSAYADWNMNQTVGRFDPASAYAVLRAMSLGLFSSASLAFDTRDYHFTMLDGQVDFSSPSYDGRGNPMYNEVLFLGNMISNLYEMADQLPHPFAPDEKLSDYLLTSITSEFIRTIAALGESGPNCYVNWQDGGNNGIILIGKHISRGSFGNWSDSGLEIPFNPQTGEDDPTGNKITNAELYATILKAVGLPENIRKLYTAAKAADCFFKPGA